MKKQPHHINGKLHVTGQTRFILDEIKPSGLLYMKILYSVHARAKIVSVNTFDALKTEGVVGIYTAKDVPGKNQIGVVMHDEPLLPSNEVSYVGQPVAIVVGESPRACKRAVDAINVTYEPLTPVLTIEDALEKGMVIGEENLLKKGNPEAVWEKCPNIIEGEVRGGGQEHLYLETQRTRVVPDEDNHYYVYAGTQSPSETQEICARVLNLNAKDITVEVKRLGGAFGGKERSSVIFSALAALASYKTGKPVEFEMSRHDDIAYTGKRHPFVTKYKVGFDDNGKLIAGDFKIYLNGGAFTDLSLAILERAVWHIDNAYNFPHIKVCGKALRTNLPPNTAFRGFGAPQGIFSIEYIMQRIARKTAIDIFDIRLTNTYKENGLTPYGQEVKEVCFDEIFSVLKKNSNYRQLRKECDDFNRSNKFLKKGIGLVPVKFGISFTATFLNQASALVWVYTDGTVSVSHGGIEMGQELNTKIAQIVARTLGVEFDKIKIESTNVKRVGNSSSTAASSGTDLNGNAAKLAAAEIKSRLVSVAAQMLGTDIEDNIVFENGLVFDKSGTGAKLKFADVVKKAYMDRINLGAQAFYKTPGIHFDTKKRNGKPFYYFVFGAALSQVEIDTLTGATKVEKVFIVHENGQSVNLEVDLGQIEGAYIQSMGWVTMEEVVVNGKGENLSNTTSTYKIPTYDDIPGTFEVEILSRDRKFSSVFGSKGIGEPPFIYGISAFLAIKDAVESVGNHKFEVELQSPATPERVLNAVEKIKHYADDGDI